MDLSQLRVPGPPAQIQTKPSINITPDGFVLAASGQRPNGTPSTIVVDPTGHVLLAPDAVEAIAQRTAEIVLAELRKGLNKTQRGTLKLVE